MLATRLSAHHLGSSLTPSEILIIDRLSFLGLQLSSGHEANSPQRGLLIDPELDPSLLLPTQVNTVSH